PLPKAAKPGDAICQEYRGGRFSVSCGAGRSLRQRLQVTRTAMKQAGRPPSDFDLAFDFDLDLSAPLTTMAERRH
ncbi:hypothetical protein, partial [Pseudomonas protegens]|uniref:hypothetical protein n=1 Tax=Pseudomonas protegens TaxID=380021 RepID=UPI00228223AD